ncbi:MAG: hypothetical protein L6R41_005233 [Letrouitia leprolyta]|nr:MAG: hypothetical protein L6R41_005233 [Letrouitia leprolyta]
MRAADRESNQSLGTDINIENTSNQSQFFESIAIPKCASSRGGTMKGTEISDLFAAWPPIRDELSTETSELQDDTIRECLPFLTGSTGPMSDHMKHGVPGLARYKHIDFLRSSLETMPAAFVGFDASRPWIVYWALTALRLLGEDLEEYRERYSAPRAITSMLALRPPKIDVLAE